MFLLAISGGQHNTLSSQIQSALEVTVATNSLLPTFLFSQCRVCIQE